VQEHIPRILPMESLVVGVMQDDHMTFLIELQLTKHIQPSI
jgi:hypothetical protein